MRWGFAVCLTMMLVGGSYAHAAKPKPDAQHRLVATLYDAYIASQNDDDSEAPDTLAIIEKNASKSMKRALRLEKRCSMKTHEICAMDADITINGQDWQLSEVALSDLKAGSDDAKIVRAEFINSATKTRVDYHFVREDGAWKIDEIEAVNFKEDGSTDNKSRWRLKEHIFDTLKQFNETRVSFLYST